MAPDRKRSFERLCHRLGDALGCSLPPSQVLRVCAELLMQDAHGLQRAAEGVGPLRRPSNDDRHGMRRFEDSLADLVGKSLASGRSERLPRD